MSNLRKTAERCVLCLEEKRSPVHIKCGHSFCFNCFDMYKSCRKYPWAAKCPICRDVLKETSSVHWFIYLLLIILFIAFCTGGFTLPIHSFIKSIDNIYHH